jgi:hypothetical protein
MTNGTLTYLHRSPQQNGLTVPQLQLENAFANGQPDMAIAVAMDHALRPTLGMSLTMQRTETCTATSNPVGGGGLMKPASCHNHTIAFPDSAGTTCVTPQRHHDTVHVGGENRLE